jgi:ectoine hydroxylase-related dioxygenase (phytanoyl-CoA dioxygenase family)
MNVWRESAYIKDLVSSPILGELAGNLLGVRSVRLSHDQVLYKRPESTKTPVHADQYHWPVSGPETITFWIPLQPVAPNQGRLRFFRGSHRLQPETRRQLFKLSSEEGEFFLLQCGFTEVEPVLELGDATAHYGWTFHGSGCNLTNETRKVYGVVYMAADIKLVVPEYGPPLEFLRDWCPGARVGGPMDSERNPIVFTNSNFATPIPSP